jgi:hypothetical protein
MPEESSILFARIVPHHRDATFAEFVLYFGPAHRAPS